MLAHDRPIHTDPLVTGCLDSLCVGHLANGDHVHYAYTSSVNLTEGMMTTGSNKFEITGGTGKFKAIKGKGGCTGKGNADGSSTWTCTRTYTGVK